jgi:hypothetical protein
VADNIYERMTGVLAWGQWRGWIPPDRLGGQVSATREYPKKKYKNKIK